MDGRALIYKSNEGKKYYGRFGLFFLPPFVLFFGISLYAIFIQIATSFFISFFLLLIIMMLLILIKVIFGYDELIVFENGIQLPDKPFSYIFMRKKNLIPFTDIAKIVQQTIFLYRGYPAFIIHRKNGKKNFINKEFVMDIEELGKVLKERCDTFKNPFEVEEEKPLPDMSSLSPELYSRGLLNFLIRRKIERGLRGK